MTSDKEKNAQEKTTHSPTPVPPKPITVEESLKNNVLLIDKSVKAKNTRQIHGRLLRQTAAIRSKLTPKTILSFLETLIVENEESVDYLKDVVKQYEVQVGSNEDEAMEVAEEPEATKAAPVSADGDDKMDEAPAAADASTPVAAETTSAPALAAAAAAADEKMDVEGEIAAAATANEPPMPFPPEVELYAYILVMTLLCDAKQYEKLKEVATRATSLTQAWNRRTMDALASRVWSLLSLAHERTGTLDAIRSTLLAQHRTAQLRHDLLGQETLLCLILRNFLHYGQYDQAERFRAKAQHNEPFASSQQYCRYLYYFGRIHAVRLEYSEAKECLQQAIRRAPSVAGGFLTSATKWLSLVLLLLGETPERSDFFQPLPAKLQPSTATAVAGGSKKASTGSSSAAVATAVRSVRPLAPSLKPYFLLTMAVKNGVMDAFAAAEAKYAATFAADRTQALVARLRQSVLRAGIRRICAAYSRISLADVATMLQLPSSEDAEYVMAKAIATGAVNAVIDHAAGEVVTRGATDVYVSTEPQESFHERTVFCMDLHNEAVRAMQFEPEAHRHALQAFAARSRPFDDEDLYFMDEDDLI